MVKDRPANSGDTCPGATKPTCPSTEALAPDSLCSATGEVTASSSAAAGEPPPLATTRESPRAAMNAQHSQKVKIIFFFKKRNVNWTECKTVDQN